MPIANRTIQDSSLQITRVCPAQNTDADSASLDLGSVALFPTNEELSLEVAIPATDTLASGQTITVTIEDSADDSTFAAIDELATVVATGIGGDTSAAVTKYLKLPDATRQYLRINVACSATSGDVTDTTVTASILT